MSTKEKDLTTNEACATTGDTCSSEKKQTEANLQHKQEVEVAEVKKEEKMKSGGCGCS